MTRERSAGLLVFRERGGKREFLLVRSRRHGAWGFPKGHVLPGESDQAAARRETLEETGLAEVEIVPGFSRALRYPLPGSDVEKEAVYFLARCPAGAASFAKATEPAEAGKRRWAEAPGAADPEIAEARWAARDEALGLLAFADARELLLAAEGFLSGGG